MKICHVITRLIIGGAQENTVLTCRGLASKGHLVTLVAGPETGPEGSLWPQARNCGAEVVELPPLRRAVRPLNDLRACRELVRLFRTIEPDVVHTHSSKAGILGRAAAHRAGVPAVVHTIHGMSFNRTQHGWTRWAYRIIERRAARWTHKFVAVADAMIEQSLAAGIGVRDQMVTIRSGLDVDRFGPDEASRRAVRAAWGVTEGQVVVGTIARLFQNKGYEDIIKAMPSALRQVPDLRFVWIGDGAHRERYTRELSRLGVLDRVLMVGLIQPDEVGRLIKGFDLLVHASRWEGLPRAVVQALLSEVPVVCFNNDGGPEVVFPEVTGLLVPLGDIAALSNGIVRLARDAGLRQKMGQNGRKLCMTEFDANRMVDQVEALYFDLLRCDRLREWSRPSRGSRAARCIPGKQV